VRVAIPCHYATFGLLLPDASGFVAAMEGANARVVVPAKGQAFTP
jgi:L-ascorbate metabolism protein UlaG (beta-lactamase superfamily)